MHKRASKQDALPHPGSCCFLLAARDNEVLLNQDQCILLLMMHTNNSSGVSLFWVGITLCEQNICAFFEACVMFVRLQVSTLINHANDGE